MQIQCCEAFEFIIFSFSKIFYLTIFIIVFSYPIKLALFNFSTSYFPIFQNPNANSFHFSILIVVTPYNTIFIFNLFELIAIVNSSKFCLHQILSILCISYSKDNTWFLNQPIPSSLGLITLFLYNLFKKFMSRPRSLAIESKRQLRFKTHMSIDKLIFKRKIVHLL
jgi:hypothetical protein